MKSFQIFSNEVTLFKSTSVMQVKQINKIPCQTLRALHLRYR